MRIVSSLMLLLAVALLMRLAQSSTTFAHELNFNALRVASAAPSPDAEKGQTFTGRIAQAEGKYVLVDDAKQVTYQLDDQEKAKSFDGKNVKVTGNLDTATNTIHVANIEAA